jgi:type 1 glutamine amidotransferase
MTSSGFEEKSMKRALVVRGGWAGHQPVEATELFIPFLKSHDYVVAVHDGPEVYADPQTMAGIDLVVHCVTMSTIERDQLDGLRAAVAAGTGLAGWHGGICDSYRSSADYLQLIGGQFANHPPVAPQARTGEQSDYYLPHRIEFTAGAAHHPITADLQDFELTTEQYWVLTDDYCNVLATTTLQPQPWHLWRRPVTCPAVWTRNWGDGRIFVATPGHRVEVLEQPSVRTLIERGMLWASR